MVERDSAGPGVPPLSLSLRGVALGLSQNIGILRKRQRPTSLSDGTDEEEEWDLFFLRRKLRVGAIE